MCCKYFPTVFIWLLNLFMWADFAKQKFWLNYSNLSAFFLYGFWASCGPQKALPTPRLWKYGECAYLEHEMVQFQEATATELIECQGKLRWALWGICLAHISPPLYFSSLWLFVLPLGSPDVPPSSPPSSLIPVQRTVWFSVFVLVFQTVRCNKWGSVYLQVSHPRTECNITDDICICLHPLPFTPPPRHFLEWASKAAKVDVWHICPGLAQFQWESLMLQDFHIHLHFPDLQSYRLPWLPSNSIKTKKASWVCTAWVLGEPAPGKQMTTAFVLGPFLCPNCPFSLGSLGISAIKFLSLVGSITSQCQGLS